MGNPIQWAEASQYLLQPEIPLTGPTNAFIDPPYSNGYDDSQPPDNIPSTFDSLDLNAITAGDRNVEEQADGNLSEYPFLTSPFEGTAPQDVVGGAVLSPDSPEDQPSQTRVFPMPLPYSFDSHSSGKNRDFKKNSKAMREFWMKDLGRFVDNNKILKVFSKHAKEKVATANTLRASALRRKGPARFRCTIMGCSADFTRKHNLESECLAALSARCGCLSFLDHLKSHCGVTDRICPNCGRGFTTIPVCKRHSRTCEKARKAAA